MVRLKNDRSVWLFLLETPEEEAWVKESWPSDLEPLEPWQWTGKKSFALQPEPASVLVFHMQDAGFILLAEGQEKAS